MSFTNASRCAAGVALGLACAAPWSAAQADPEATELARRSQNPIEPTIKVPVQENLEFGLGSYDRLESLLKLEPVIPIPLVGEWAIVTRTIIPIEYAPDTTAATGGSWGLGDVNPTFFVSPDHLQLFQWGAGPDLQLPTATTSSTGTGKWCLGPSIAFVFKPRDWVVGAIVSNVWSIAGSSSRSAVNQLSVEYFVHYNLPGGWTLEVAPTMTANWNAKAGQVWTIPVGGGVGRVIKIGALAVHPTVQAYDYVDAPPNGPSWELRLQITFLARE